jgi:RNA polymerase sigma factor (sigma-70 family)
VNGDERAFAAIFSRYHQDLYRFCLAIVRNPQDAQDALQNTMVKVLRALPGEERQIDLRPWLYRIAHNESVELLRRRRPTEELDPELISRGGGLAEDAESRERLRRLIADLEQLPDRQRGALVMRELSGLDFAEIGTALGTSAVVARQTLYEARLSLRQMDEGREMSCDLVTQALSDADGRVTRRRDIRAHLRACPDCRRFRDEIAGRREDLGSLAPLPAVAATGLLQGLLGGVGASSGTGAGLTGAAAGGTAKSLGAGAAIKSAAAVAVVAAVGFGVADRSGVIDVTPWGGGGPQRQAQSEQAVEGDAPSVPSKTTGVGLGDGGPATVKSAALSQGARAAGAKTEGEAGAGGAAGAPTSAANGEAPPAAVGDAAGGSHPHGRGHEKQHPDAASQGQQTAASHKSTGKGVGGGRGGGADKSHPANSSKPTKPSKPAKPPRAGQPAANGGGKVATPPKGPANSGAAAPPKPNPFSQPGEPEESPTPPKVGRQP